MITGAIVSCVSFVLGYLLKTYETKALQSKYRDVKEQLAIARELEKEKTTEPINFYDQ